MPIGFFGILTLIFIVLKLTNYIGWSWAWVLAPVWIPLALALVVAAGLAVYTVASGKKKR